MAYVIVHRTFRTWVDENDPDAVVKQQIKYLLSDGVNTKIEYQNVGTADVGAMTAVILGGLDQKAIEAANL